MSSRENKRKITSVQSTGAKGVRITKTVTMSQSKNKNKNKNNKSRPRSNPNVLRMAGKDLVTFLPDQVISSDQDIFSVITANPCYWKGTRISQVAAAYQAYKINRISFEYVPQVSVGYNGSVIAGTLWDAAPSVEALQQTLVTSPGGKINVCYRRFTSRPSLSGLQQRRFNTNGELAQSTNPFIFMAMIRGGQLAFQNPSLTQVVPGFFWVHYDFSFYNPIGSGWIYGVSYNTTISDLPVVSTNNESLVALRPFGTFGTGTVFDYDGGVVKFRGAEINVPADIHFNYYYNGTMVSQNSQLTMIKTKLDTITGVQISDNATSDDATWTTLQPYRAGETSALPAGVPGKITIRLMRNTDTVTGNYRWMLSAWMGVSEWNLFMGTFQYPIYYFQYPCVPTENYYIRVKTNLGRHSTPILLTMSIFGIKDALDKTQPASVALNYLDSDPAFTNDDDEPVEPADVEDMDLPILDGLSQLPPPVGPTLDDLDPSVPFFQGETHELEDISIGAAVGPEDYLCWVLTSDTLCFMPAYFFRPSEASIVQYVDYGRYNLYRAPSTIHSDYEGWMYIENSAPEPVEIYSNTITAIPEYGLYQVAPNQFVNYVTRSDDQGDGWVYVLNGNVWLTAGDLPSGTSTSLKVTLNGIPYDPDGDGHVKIYSSTTLCRVTLQGPYNVTFNFFPKATSYNINFMSIYESP